jgi:hypothetical protein
MHVRLQVLTLCLVPIVLVGYVLITAKGQTVSPIQSLQTANVSTPQPFLAPLSPTVPAACPVTIANGSTPPRERPAAVHHGNGSLWTVLWSNGIILATPQYVAPDGSVDMKFPWWRGLGIHGRLTIEGRRLDAPAAPLRASIPDGYGESGFQATGIIFPTEGCWEVTGRAGSASLTFVTWVVRVTGGD